MTLKYGFNSKYTRKSAVLQVCFKNMVPCFNNTMTCSDDTFSVLSFNAFREQHTPENRYNTLKWRFSSRGTHSVLKKQTSVLLFYKTAACWISTSTCCLDYILMNNTPTCCAVSSNPVFSFNHIWSTMRHCAFRRWKLWIYFEEKKQKLSQLFHIYTIF